jgi:1-acyl-sn-glycerol-3-phosphate acyltransferase
MFDNHPIVAALAAVYRAAREGLPPGGLDEADPAFLAEVNPLLEFLWTKYFRVDLRGLEHVPATGPALLVANHSGGLPYDGMLLMYGIRRNHPQHRALRALVATFAFRSRVSAPVVTRYGCVRASMENGARLLGRGELVAAFPEGLRGVGKLYRERYRLTRFGRGGFVRLAAEAGVPILPVAVIGAEEIHPVIGKLHTLARPLGLPYIPVTPTFPFLGPLGLLPLPTKWTIEIGAPILPPPVDAGEKNVLEVAETVRDRIDAMISRLVLARRSIFRG